MDNEYFASINEVSKRLSVPAHTLRYWEKQFPVAIRPTTGAGGRRYYRTETVNKLMVIKDLLYNRGMTIAGVKKLLRDGNLPDTVSDDAITRTIQPQVVKSVPVSQPASQQPIAVQTKNIDSTQIQMAIDILEKAKKILSVA